MKIALASDHAGFQLKETLKNFLEENGHEVVDCGAYEENPEDDYPGFVMGAARTVARGEADRGIIMGGSGQGEAMAANRIPGVRAAVIYSVNKDIVRLSREHNDANMLSLAARFLNDGVAKEIVALWLETEFSGEERHVRRIKKLDQ